VEEGANKKKKKLSEEDLGAIDHAGSSRHSVLAIKSLSWRASKVDRFFKRLDHKASKGKS